MYALIKIKCKVAVKLWCGEIEKTVDLDSYNLASVFLPCLNNSRAVGCIQNRAALSDVPCAKSCRTTNV